jgi:hypothetical protein
MKNELTNHITQLTNKTKAEDIKDIIEKIFNSGKL